MANPLAMSGRKVAKTIGWTLAGIIILIAAVLGAGTALLTPERITRMVNDELSKKLDADFRAENIRYTLWSTFPELTISVDSLSIVSRSLDSLPDSVRKGLPADASLLATSGKIMGSVNVRELLKDTVVLGDLSARHLTLNMVRVSDSTANWNIMPRNEKRRKIPYISVRSLRLTQPGKFVFTDVPSGCEGFARLDSLTVANAGGQYRYRAALAGTAAAHGGKIPEQLDRPLDFGGIVDICMNPMKLMTKDFSIYFNGIKIALDLGADIPAMALNFNAEVRDGDKELKINGHLADPTGEPAIEADVKGNMSLNDFKYPLPALDKMEIEGRLTADTRLKLRIADLKGNRLENTQINGTAYLENFKARNLGDIDLITADHMTLRFGARAADVTERELRGSLFDFKSTVRNLSFSAAGYKAKATSVTLTSEIANRGRVPLSDIADDVPFKVAMKASTMDVGNSKDTLRLHIKDADVRGNISARLKGQLHARTYDVSVKGSSLAYAQGMSRFSINDFNTSLHAAYLNHDVYAPNFKTPAAWRADDAIALFARSTPRTVRLTAPAQLQRIMARWNVTLRIRGSKGMLLTPAFPVKNYLTNIDVGASFDSIAIHNMSVRSQSSAITFTGAIRNIRQFLTSRNPAPLRLNLTASVDTLQCNELAAAYERGVELVYGPGTVQKRLSDNRIVASDSVAMVIPRNIYADIRATINKCIYTDLLTYDWLGNIHVADGNLRVDSLAVSTDFVGAGASFRYDTSNLENLSTGADISVRDLNVKEFFRNFPKVLKAMPMMANLSGVFEARASLSTRLYPTMYLMLPATVGDINVRGLDLVLKQNKFIRKITRMMMIPTGDPLHIANMNINARMFDNLLALYPFKISFDKYDLTIGGLNNFDGRLYYHIGIDKWPLRVPFGLNVKGTYRHPEVRFGGAKWKDRNATEIVNDIDNDIRINVIQMMKKYGLLMIHKAAQANTTSDYIFTSGAKTAP